MNREKIIMWGAIGLMCAIFAGSASMYLFKHEMVHGFFEELKFPTWLIYPLAIAKILGVIAVLSNRSRVLKEWAYAGFFFDAVLATAAHYYADHSPGLSLLAVVVVVTARFYDGKVRG